MSPTPMFSIEIDPPARCGRTTIRWRDREFGWRGMVEGADLEHALGELAGQLEDVAAQIDAERAYFRRLELAS